jgi:hypothetical protein
MDASEAMPLCNPSHDLNRQKPINQPVNMQPVFIVQLVNTGAEQSD